MMETGEKVPFGRLDVEAGEKGELVRGVFSRVAKRYDVMNDMMALGMHRLWRRIFLDRLGVYEGMNLLDVAGGTGDIAFRAVERGCRCVTVADMSEDMMEVGRDRLVDKGVVSEVVWVAAAGEYLPFESHTMDACTIAFGLRNVVDIEAVLGEMHRVLRPGGRMLCLEFSRPPSKALEKVFDGYNRWILPKVGRLVVGDGSPYRYLAESIERFPDAESIMGMMEDVGYTRVSCERLSGGIVALHKGWKV